MSKLSDQTKAKKSLNVVKGVTCFSIQEKYKVNCERSSCPHWIKSSQNQNCSLIAAQNGPKTLQEIGEYFDLTRMRICQIEKSIYEKIRMIDPE